MDCSEDKIDFGYAKLVDKHFMKYEKIFAENERKLNRYQNIEVITIDDNGIDEHCEHNNRCKRIEVITITDNNDNTVEKRNCDDMAVKRVQNEKEIQHQTTTSFEQKKIDDMAVKSEMYEMERQLQTTSSSINEDNSVYNDLYKPTNIYTCMWWTCGFVTTDFKLITDHLHSEHIETKAFIKYSRSFVKLNVYKYNCLQCDYGTKIHDIILKHVCEHNEWKCLVIACDKCFATKDELSLHEKQHRQEWSCKECGRSYSTERNLKFHTGCKPWKCFARLCGKRFMTKQKLKAHKKLHVRNCLLNKNECLNGKGVKKCLNGKGVCSLENIKKWYRKKNYQKRKVENEVEYDYVCLWPKCGYKTRVIKDIEHHIHGSHVCGKYRDTRLRATKL